MRERLVPLEGTQNFRDLGGYPTEDGRTVRWGFVYRSDALSTLTPSDIARLETLGLRLVIDFRGEEETYLEPGPYRGHERVAYRHLPIGENASPAEWRERFRRGELGAFDEGWLARSYTGMLDRIPDRFASVLRALAEDDLPAVFHCTAGKDRTGVMAALLLRLLGVPRTHVVADYALSSHYTRGASRAATRWFGELGLERADVSHLLSALPGNMETALDHLDAEHGGAERYARERMGLEGDVVVALRERLLTAS